MERVFTREQLIAAQKKYLAEWAANPEGFYTLEEVTKIPDAAERGIDNLLALVD